MTDTPAAAAPARDWYARVEVVALTLLIGAGLEAWVAGGIFRWYDYDEVARVHSAWLAAQGLRPYSEFFEVHPPYFALLTPLARAFPDPVAALRAFRAFGSLGNLLFVAGLAALMTSAAKGPSRRWAWLGLALVASQPAVLNFLLEYRIDGWGYAIAVWGFYRHGRTSPGMYRDFELGLTTGLATLLFCPKLTFLPALIVGFEQLMAWKSARTFLKAVAGYGLGVGLAGGLFLLYLAWQGIDPWRTSELLVRYHAISGANSGFHHGLLQALMVFRVLSMTLLAGVLAWVVLAWRRGRRPRGYEVGVVAWVGVQVLLVAYPYVTVHGVFPPHISDRLLMGR